MEMIDKIFTKNSNPLIISSDLVDDQVASVNVDNENPLIVVDGDLKGEKLKGYISSYPTYVLTFETIKKLRALIFEFMRSRIWNIKSPIFILDLSEGPYDINASKVLRFLGSFDVLVAYYLCYDNIKNSTMVYTLNSYTHYAPQPWSKVRHANSSSKTKSTIYSLQYPKGNNLVL